jgi:hypothetical protein
MERDAKAKLEVIERIKARRAKLDSKGVINTE